MASPPVPLVAVTISYIMASPPVPLVTATTGYTMASPPVPLVTATTGYTMASPPVPLVTTTNGYIMANTLALWVMPQLVTSWPVLALIGSCHNWLHHGQSSRSFGHCHN